MSNTPLQTAIPLGRNRGAKEAYHFGNFLSYIGKDGQEINPWVKDANGEDKWVDPKTDPNYDHTEALAFKPGEVAKLPHWDKDFISEMLAVEDFARPGLLEKVQGWIKDGLESHDLIAKVREEKGLVTLKDFGIDEDTLKPRQDVKPAG